MASSVFSSPTRAFEEVLDKPKANSPWLVVIISALFLAVAGYFTSSQAMGAVYFFIAGIVQWLVLTAVVWFFEFVHTKKKKGLLVTDFNGIAAVTGKLWRITAVTNLIAAIIAFLFPLLNQPLFDIIGLIGFILGLGLVILWLIASFKMLKVVTGLQKGRLFVNWIILLVVNSLTTLFIVTLLVRLF